MQVWLWALGQPRARPPMRRGLKRHRSHAPCRICDAPRARPPMRRGLKPIGQVQTYAWMLKRRARGPL